MSEPLRGGGFLTHTVYIADFRPLSGTTVQVLKCKTGKICTLQN